MNANPKSKNLIIEMGAAKPKDIHYLSSFLKPNVGVITNIGNSHLENLKNINGVLKVKSELVLNIKTGGCLIVPSGNKKHLKFWRSIREDIQIITFGLDCSSDFYAEDIEHGLSKLQFIIRSDKYKIKEKVNSSLAGEHNVLNILASYAVSNCLNYSSALFIKSLEKDQNSIIRQKQLKWIKGSILIDDTYNANPDSVKRAIDLLTSSSKRKILVLGDMLELGSSRKRMHEDIGKYAALNKIDIFLGFGDLTKYAVDKFGNNGFFFKDEEILKVFLKKNVNSKDIVLLKGSRGMKMERFINV
jgi:UDP-N-acetylmuramoyl-tripeptide--D-alanyl-D-alanine ligase